MTDHSLDKKGVVASGSVLLSSSVTAKKTWQTPKLTEIDYSKTNESVGSGTDDSFGTS
jgi:hypothetical protein